MSTSARGSEAASYRVLPLPPEYLEPEEAQTSIEYLPFTVRQVASAADLRKAIDLRHMAYARHLPEFASALRAPESDDLESGVAILIAESKLDKSILGTVRIQTNLSNPLNMEHSIKLPRWLQNKRLAEVRRLAVAPGNAGRLVKMVLLKAVYQFCVHQELEWILVAARRPLDRMYEQLTLKDVLDGQTFIPLPRANNVEHRVLGLETRAFLSQLVAVEHPLLDFFFHTEHPDINPDCLTPMDVELRLGEDFERMLPEQNLIMAS
ncbi:MAG: N-acyl amino acid synthase FeeM domain-containing protein [Pseudomonadota bacterium]